jgi:Zn-dependent peptidase ImmA (M78 family)
MLLTISRLAKNGFNTRRMTEADFFRICETEHITVKFETVDTSFYFAILGRKFITLPNHFTGLQRLFAMYHELGHYFLHQRPVQALFYDRCEGPQEEEADSFAAIALYPYPELLLEGFNDPTDTFERGIYRRRIMILNTYNF